METIGGVMYGCASVSAVLASIHVHRKRGHPAAWRALRHVPSGLAMVLVLATVGGPFAARMGALVAGAGLLGYLGLAFFRIVRPYKAPAEPGVTQQVSPTFTPYHG